MRNSIHPWLQSELDLKSVREVEDLIIEGISCGIMNGKLDQKRERFEVDFVIGRDIRQVSHLIVYRGLRHKDLLIESANLNFFFMWYYVQKKIFSLVLTVIAPKHCIQLE